MAPQHTNNHAYIQMQLPQKRQKKLTEQFDGPLGRSQLIGGLAHVLSVLSFFDCDYPKGCISKFIRNGEMRDAVVLVVGQGDFFFFPGDRGRRVRLYVTFEIHVELQGLAETWTRHSYDGSKFNLDGDVSYQEILLKA